MIQPGDCIISLGAGTIHEQGATLARGLSHLRKNPGGDGTRDAEALRADVAPYHDGHRRPRRNFGPRRRRRRALRTSSASARRSPSRSSLSAAARICWSAMAVSKGSSPFSAKGRCVKSKCAMARSWRGRGACFLRELALAARDGPPGWLRMVLKASPAMSAAVCA